MGRRCNLGCIEGARYYDPVRTLGSPMSCYARAWLMQQTNMGWRRPLAFVETTVKLDQDAIGIVHIKASRGPANGTPLAANSCMRAVGSGTVNEKWVMPI